MVEMIVAAALVTFAVMAVTRTAPDLQRPRAGAWGAGMSRLPGDLIMAGIGREGEPDLPCPWCRAATGENDVRCASCGQPFG